MHSPKTKAHVAETAAASPSPASHGSLDWIAPATASALFLIGLAFLAGHRAGRRAAWRRLSVTNCSAGTSVNAIASASSHLLQVSPEPGVETFFDRSGYKIRIEKTREHRYLAERHLKRALGHDEVVHHVNGRRSDNRLENLCVLNKLKHEQFHAWLTWKKEKQGAYPPELTIREILTSEYGAIHLAAGNETGT